MNTATHVRITTEALRSRFQPGSLPLIIRANLAQDRLTNLVGHPEIHFDDSAFAAAERYVEQQRKLAVRALSRQDRRAALHAFGRLLHGRQDFYAHSNWAARWVEQQGGLAQCRPEDIDLCPDPRAVPGLISGTGSAWHFLAVHVPLYGRLHRRFFLPANSHEAMNLDDSSRGPLFPFAVAAAIKHTRLELELLLALIDQAAGADAVVLSWVNPKRSPMPNVTLKPGRDKPVRNRHPWIFSGGIESIDRSAADGEIVDVYNASGEWLARGTLNRRSQIQVRLLSWENAEAIDEAFWRGRLQRAIDGRAALAADPSTTAYRLVHAESDGLPGLIVERYGDWLVLQSLTLGIERAKPLIVKLLAELCKPQGIVERSDVDVREKEGLRPVTGLLEGSLPEPAVVEVLEHGHRFLVDLLGGQKTGFYLDQRENRQLAAAYCQGARVLNAFSYTGAFAVYALAAGAEHVINLDSSMESLELGERNLALNSFDPDTQAEGVAGDVFQVLRDWRTDGERFDVIILDPPKFAHSQQQVEHAARAYKDINLLAMQLLSPGGTLISFSCSGLVSADLFQKILFGAAVDAKRDVQVVERLSQGSDHPVLLSFPEGEYLKGLICRVW